LLPGALFGLVQIDFGANSKQITTSYFGDPTDTQSFGASIPRVVFVTTVSAAVALNNPFVTTPTLVLGVCSVLLTAFAIVFLELALTVASDERFGATGGFAAANGGYTRRASSAAVQQNGYWYCLRDFAVVATLAFSLATFTLEDFRFDHLGWQEEYQDLQPNWKLGQFWLGPRQGVMAVIIAVCQNLAMVTMVSELFFFPHPFCPPPVRSLFPLRASLASARRVAQASSRRQGKWNSKVRLSVARYAWPAAHLPKTV
jgi:hypothetical protein